MSHPVTFDPGEMRLLRQLLNTFQIDSLRLLRGEPKVDTATRRVIQRDLIRSAHILALLGGEKL
jgi:hypothetical protein